MTDRCHRPGCEHPRTHHRANHYTCVEEGCDCAGYVREPYPIGRPMPLGEALQRMRDHVRDSPGSQEERQGTAVLAHLAELDAIAAAARAYRAATHASRQYGSTVTQADVGAARIALFAAIDAAGPTS